MRDCYDVCIIGAGVVGTAIANELVSENFNEKFSILVLDAQKEPGGETSIRNSGVLHSGFHEKPETLKARLAHQGSRLARQFAEAHNVPILHTGMLIAIPKGALSGGLWREWKALWRLWLNGRAQDIAFEFLTSRGIRAKEPNIKARMGIFVHDVWVVDQQIFMKSLVGAAMRRKVEFQFAQKVVALAKMRNTKGRWEFAITTSHGRFRAKAIINAAGLYADEIANMALAEKRYKIYPWRGEYYEIINPQKRKLVRGLVYPALPENASGKGIHFSPRPDGRMFLGPSAVPVEQKDDYNVRKTAPEIFLKTARMFGIELAADDIAWSYSGIRPKLSDAPSCENDFKISVDLEEPLLVNYIGIESPGFSAAMGIARYTCEMPKVYKFCDHILEKENSPLN